MNTSPPDRFCGTPTRARRSHVFCVPSPCPLPCGGDALSGHLTRLAVYSTVRCYCCPHELHHEIHNSQHPCWSLSAFMSIATSTDKKIHKKRPPSGSASPPVPRTARERVSSLVNTYTTGHSLYTSSYCTVRESAPARGGARDNRTPKSEHANRAAAAGINTHIFIISTK